MLCIFPQEDRERAEEEISILKKLNDDKIIRCEGSHSTKSETIILMEYLEGGELFDRVSEESFTLTETDCVDFLTQICQGVSYLQSKNIIHLDLKVSKMRRSVSTPALSFTLHLTNEYCSQKISSVQREMGPTLKLWISEVLSKFLAKR